jgi:hypothetical protein
LGYNYFIETWKIIMKKFLAVLAISLMFIANVDAKGGGSSGGGGHASSGGHSSMSSGSKGGFSSSAGVGSRPSAPAAAPRTTTTTTTTTYARSSSGNYYHYNSPYIGGGMMYGGWGMGYGYNNGLLTGMIIANMMHPVNTVMYVGPGQYSNNALLYPDGRVVNQQGYQVGVYQNGQFTAMNGGMVAQPVPQDAGAQQVQPQPVVIQSGPTAGDIVAMVLLGFVAIILFIILIGILV